MQDAGVSSSLYTVSNYLFRCKSALLFNILLFNPLWLRRHPRKRIFGPWVYRLLSVLARFKRLRGTWLDVFGYTVERRIERELRDDYISMLDYVRTHLTAANLDIAISLAKLPERIRGFGHVKRQHIERAQGIELDLLSQFKAATIPDAEETYVLQPQAGALKSKGPPQ